MFDDGTVAVRWMTAKRSTSVWASMEDMLAIHGHPEYGSVLRWETEAEVERLKEAIYEALNNEEDRADYDCKCLDCQYTLTGVGETLRKALEAKP